MKISDDDGKWNALREIIAYWMNERANSKTTHKPERMSIEIEILSSLMKERDSYRLLLSERHLSLPQLQALVRRLRDHPQSFLINNGSEYRDGADCEGLALCDEAADTIERLMAPWRP